MFLNTNEPVVVAFAGNAGAGKTSTANAIVPRATLTMGLPEVLWDHTFFAKPIYDMVTVKTQIKGPDSQDRMLYGLHDIVYDLVQRRCSYESLIELVYDLYDMPCEMSDDDDKPRTFMQTAGDYCRAQYEDCFAEYAIRDIRNRFYKAVNEYDLADQDPPLSINIISDLRMRNEFDLVRSQPNNIIIKFVANQEELDRRLMERSGKALTHAQLTHKSESELATISDEEFDIIVDTTTLSLNDQAAMVKEAILSMVTDKVSI